LSVLLLLNGDLLYSITRAGFYALEGLGSFHLGATVDREPEAHKSQVPHALEVNSIRLALMRTLKLRDWIPESYIRAVNLVPTSAYAKVYDAIATMLIADNEIEFAIDRGQAVSCRFVCWISNGKRALRRRPASENRP